MLDIVYSREENVEGSPHGGMGWCISCSSHLLKLPQNDEMLPAGQVSPCTQGSLSSRGASIYVSEIATNILVICGQRKKSIWDAWHSEHN